MEDCASKQKSLHRKVSLIDEWKTKIETHFIKIQDF